MPFAEIPHHELLREALGTQAGLATVWRSDRWRMQIHQPIDHRVAEVFGEGRPDCLRRCRAATALSYPLSSIGRFHSRREPTIVSHVRIDARSGCSLYGGGKAEPRSKSASTDGGCAPDPHVAVCGARGRRRS